MILGKTFVGQGCRLGREFSAENCLFFANCEGFHGEACSVLDGPDSVTHHKSTLLIAGMFSFYNAGSGTNQSNHMYKLGPNHEGKLERGAKTGSFSNARAVAGFLRTGDGEPVAFSFMANNYGVSAETIDRITDAIIVAATEFRRASARP